LAVFISFEGPDKASKSTQLKLLLKYLDEINLEYVFTREPGGTPVSERIREILLDPAHTSVSVITEALLFAASRSELVTNVIRPALESGKTVICDRFVDSSLVYQGFAGGLPVEFLSQINQMATGALKPHRTIVLDLPLDVARSRRESTAHDRMERKDDWFHRQVREGYLELAKAEPRRVKVVDASADVDEVQKQIRELVQEVLPRRRRDK
jgi:dTMP kinase